MPVEVGKGRESPRDQLHPQTVAAGVQHLALAKVVADQLGAHGVGIGCVRAVDLRVKPLIMASPTWLSRPSSIDQRVLERMDAAMLSETDEHDRPVAYKRVAGVVVTGNEDGAHHVISEISGAPGDIGYTVPGQAWTCWHLGPGAGPDHLGDERGHD